MKDSWKYALLSVAFTGIGGVFVFGLTGDIRGTCMAPFLFAVMSLIYSFCKCTDGQ